MSRKKLDTIYKDSYSLESISCTYVQDVDCREDPDGNVQVLKIETVSNGCDSFYRISLPDGGHWSINDENDLMDLFKDFKSRFEHCNENN